MQDYLVFLVVAFSSGLVTGAGVVWLYARARVKTETQIEDKFKALARDTLNENSQVFMQLAATRFKVSEQETSAALEQKATAISEIVKPMKESLQTLNNELRTFEVERKVAYGELMGIANLSLGATKHLLQALQSPTARGEWGQMQLQRIFEMTGMAQYIRDFSPQYQIEDEDGRHLPDYVVNLPGDRTVVFDSKVPMDAYQKYNNCTDNAQEKTLLLEQHAKQVKAHIRKLGDKEYWKRIETTPGFVVLFMPGENLLRLALEADPSLLDFGMEQKVVLATPTTVIALLWAVKHGWNQDNLIKNVRKVEKLGTELYDALSVMTGHFVDLRGKLEGSVKSYNSAVGSFDYNVLSKARRLHQYGTVKGDGRKLLPEELKSINTDLRHVRDRGIQEG